jgi:hypothetical protein
VEFHRFTDFDMELPCCRLLYVKTDSVFPTYATHGVRGRGMSIHVVDGSFTGLPVVQFDADEQWDYATFATELLVSLRETHPPFGVLFTQLSQMGRISRGDIRIFILPPDLDPVVHFLCNLLCDGCFFVDDYLSEVLPEVTWDGVARLFPLRDVVPPGDVARVLVMVKRDLRRGWAHFGADLSIDDGAYYASEVYRAVMAWYNVMQLEVAMAHVHAYAYYEDALFPREDGHEEALLDRVHGAAAIVLSTAPDTQRQLILSMNREWGGHFHT